MLASPEKQGSAGRAELGSEGDGKGLLEAFLGATGDRGCDCEFRESGDLRGQAETKAELIALGNRQGYFSSPAPMNEASPEMEL
jgi:hypothetical protein